jgi:hypothetical protein
MRYAHVKLERVLCQLHLLDSIVFIVIIIIIIVIVSICILVRRISLQELKFIIFR